MKCPFCNSDFSIERFECEKCRAYRISGDTWINRNLTRQEAYEGWLGIQ